MRNVILLHVACCVALAVPAAAQTPAGGARGSNSARQPAVAPQGAAQTPAQAADASRSLFSPRERQFVFAGRASSVDGDPARWQRYQDMRDGVLFTDARYARADPGDRW